jgi:hypothetical protein
MIQRKLQRLSAPAFPNRDTLSLVDSVSCMIEPGEAAMPQIIIIKGYRVSSAARQEGGKWYVLCRVERGTQLVRHIRSEFHDCSRAVAESTALTSAAREVHDWLDPGE